MFKSKKKDRSLVIEIEEAQELNFLHILAKKSYETADILRISDLQPDRNGIFEGKIKQMIDVQALFAKLPSDGATVLEMDYVNGHKCKTHVIKKADGLYINLFLYERNRGDIEPLIEAVREEMAV